MTLLIDPVRGDGLVHINQLWQLVLLRMDFPARGGTPRFGSPKTPGNAIGGSNLRFSAKLQFLHYPYGLPQNGLEF